MEHMWYIRIQRDQRQRIEKQVTIKIAGVKLPMLFGKPRRTNVQQN
jgi:hypothetical protein